MIIEEALRLSTVSEYYFSKKLKEIRLLNSQGKNILNLGIGSPDLPPSPDITEELYKWAKKETSHGYQSYTGIPELRNKISGYLNTCYQVKFDPSSEILPLIGSKEGIMHISLAFINKGDTVLVPNPGYPTYSSVSRLVQANIVEYALSEETGWRINFELLEKLPLQKVKLMWLNYPNMPTGAPGDLNQFEQLIALARKHQFLIVNDNPYSMLFGDSRCSIFQVKGSREVCLELNSLSKSHNMAGWRLGWVSADTAYIQSILKVKSNMDSGMFLPLQQAACMALDKPKEWFEQLNQEYATRRKKAYKIFSLLGCHYNTDQGGMFAWGKAPEKIKDIEEWVDTMIHQAEVFLTPGFIFGSQGARYLRISLCSKPEILDEAYNRLKRAQEK